MKKIYHLLTLLLFVLSTQLHAQVASNFDMYSMKWRWGSKTETALTDLGFTNGTGILSHSAIYGSGDENKVNLTLVRNWLEESYPSSSSSGYLLLNWETGPFLTMKNNDKSSSQFKTAEAEIIKLINGVKSFRPNIKVTMYRMPFRFWTQSQNESYNGDGKFDNIFAKVDFLGPSLYILKADEEVGHARNLQYIKENLDVALAYGKKFNKPVLPFIWHRVHPFADKYASEIIQKEVLAKYIKYIYTYAFNNYKVDGVVWWDGIGGQLNNLSGINDCLNGTVYNETTYDAMIVNYAKHIKSVLTGTTVTNPVTTTTQSLANFTLINADTDEPIMTLSDDATLNLATLPTKNLNIRANTNPDKVGSVKLVLTGTVSRTQTESGSPYALFTESSGNYSSWTPPVGSYTLKATPYTSSGASGTAGTSLTINFKVINQTSGNEAPSAYAGSDKTVILPSTSVQLNGSGSDSDGSISSYSWNQVSGPSTAVFSSKTTATPTVSDLDAGTYVFGLTVKDNDGSTDTDQVTVKVTTTTTTGMQIVNIILVNADNNQDIGVITDGETLNLATLPTKNLNIRVDTYPVKVSSVVFHLTGTVTRDRIENGAPYALYTDSYGDYRAWVPPLGNYNLSATPYNEADGDGTPGASLAVDFKVINDASAPTNTTFAAATMSSTTETTTVYPNPATTQINIKAGTAGNGLSIIRLFDQAGAPVLVKKVSADVSNLKYVLDISHLANGRYILETTLINGSSFRRHVIVE